MVKGNFLGFCLNVYLLKLFIFIIYFVTSSNLQCFSANAWSNNDQENTNIDKDFSFFSKYGRALLRLVAVNVGFKGFEDSVVEGCTRRDGLMPQNGVGRTSPIFLRSFFLAETPTVLRS